MDGWNIAAKLAGVVVVVCAMYGLHRHALKLEEQGLLYYWHRQPPGSGAKSLGALQQAIEPQSQHVIEAEEQQAPIEEESGDPARWHRPRFSPFDNFDA